MPKVNIPDVKIKYIHILAKMKTWKIFGSASGEKDDLTLEYRLFRSVIIAGLIVSLLASIVSIIISSSLSVIIVAFSMFLLLLIPFYYVRYKRIYKPFVAPLIIFSFLGIAIIWIADGGINGSNLFVGFVILVLGLIIVPNKNKKYVLALFIAVIITLYLIQLYRPDLITDFATERSRWIDSIITAIYSSVFIFFIIKFLHGNYNRERKRAEENELKFRALSENSQDKIARFDRKHRLTYINKAGLEFMGLAMDQIIDKSLKDSGIFDEEQGNMLEEAIEKAFNTKQPQTEQYSVDSDKGRVYYDWRLFPEFNHNNAVDSVLGVSRDITTLKETEINLQQLNFDKDRFISILGHDLKSPFNSLLGLSEMLKENIQTYSLEEIEDLVHVIDRSLNNTYTLLEEILTWTRAQSGKIPFNPQPVDFTDICKNIVAILDPNAKTKGINVSPLAAAPISVFADSDMLRTIMRNLLSNAIKFTNEGGEIIIHAEENSDHIVISVSDNGVGIPSDDMTKLFNISEVYTTKGTAQEKGTGLGLFLCKDFVERHGGKIWAESQAGKGSTFLFTIPKPTTTEPFTSE